MGEHAEIVSAVASFGDLATVPGQMERVLHLLDEDSDYQTRTAVARLVTEPGAASLTIGRGGDFNSIALALLYLRNRAKPFEMIHAWGETALTAAAFVGGKPIIFSPTRYPKLTDRRWICAISTAREMQIICPTDTIRRSLVENGLPIDRCHLIRPGVPSTKFSRRPDQALRAKLGLAPDDYVMLACGESLQGANHHATILAATVLNVWDNKNKLLLWGRGSKTAFERRFASLMLLKKHIIFATDRLGQDAQFDQIIPASDCALLTADEPIPTLPIAVCMAAGLPIVGTVSRTACELLEDRHNCLMAFKCTSRWIARRVRDLREDPHLVWQITDTARTEAYEFFSMSRFVEQTKSVYTQLAAGKKVEIPQPSPGAGLKFMGRA
ncbi:MAG TPA: glycosyltransferase [Tepidisphaeraceae bacterium]|nr:glycosyltransferase [Tepidisphaeraceae bacterium]